MPRTATGVTSPLLRLTNNKDKDLALSLSTINNFA